jgi:methylaspartate mutase sigma subunit
VGQDDFEATRERFEEMGFDRVFDAETDPEEAIAALRRDLQITTTEGEQVRVDS